MESVRTLGQGEAALAVSPLGLGCMGMSFAYGSADDVTSLATIHRALDLGTTFLDTSDSYGPHTNERLLSQVIRDRRSQIVLATKFGQRQLPDGTRTVDGSPAYVRMACDASLQRLGLDVIDLYYQHRIDKTVPIEDTWGAMSELVTDGKVRHLGISEASPATLRRAHETYPVTALQTEWSLWTRDVEVNGVLDTVRALGIGFVAYSPLGRGFLTGAIAANDDLADDDGRRTWPRFQDDAINANRAIVKGLTDVADDLGVSPAQVALAWLLAKGADVVPIPGSRRIRHLEDNLGAVGLRLTREQLLRLDAVAPIGSAVGDRYPPVMMKAIDS